jgi:hypothetical protein
VKKAAPKKVAAKKAPAKKPAAKKAPRQEKIASLQAKTAFHYIGGGFLFPKVLLCEGEEEVLDGLIGKCAVGFSALVKFAQPRLPALLYVQALVAAQDSSIFGLQRG